MSNRIKIKICGVNDFESMKTVCNLLVDYIGFVFFEHSPRNITIKYAKNLLKINNNKCNIVALTVNANDNLLKKIVTSIKPNFIQLHGNENPSRCFEIKKKFNVKIIKALEVKNTRLLNHNINLYKGVVDIFLLDSPKSNLPGGNGKKFNWKLIKKNKIKQKWLLAGGLNLQNVRKGIKTNFPNGVDVSSGVELSKGLKSSILITKFVKMCRYGK